MAVTSEGSLALLTLPFDTVREKTGRLGNHYLAHYLDHFLWLSTLLRPLADTPCFSLSLFWFHQVVIRSSWA